MIRKIVYVLTACYLCRGFSKFKKCLIRITEKYSSGTYIFTTISFFTEKTIGLLEILKKTFVSVSLKFESYAYLAKIESGIKIKAVLARAQIIFNFC